MRRRIFAWVLLIGFVLLLLNLIVIRYYWQLSMVAYLIVVFAFLLVNGRLTNNLNKNGDESYSEKDEDSSSQDGSGNADTTSQDGAGNNDSSPQNSK